MFELSLSPNLNSLVFSLSSALEAGYLYKAKTSCKYGYHR